MELDFNSVETISGLNASAAFFSNALQSQEKDNQS